MARFYTMHLAPTLFGGWDLVREWGRIGSPGTVRIDPFETLEESERALRRIEKQKRKRGYLSRRTEVQLTITGPAPSPENGSLAK
jgi:predicted DNA-binding WGR domain protein